MPAAAPDRPRIAAFGDSLLWEASDTLRFFGGLRGVDVEVGASGGSALCDWLDPILAAANDSDIDALVVAFSGNNLTPCVQDLDGNGLQGEVLGDVYAGAAGRIMDDAPPTLPVLWVTAPANPTPNASADAVRRATVRVAGAWPNASVVDGGEHLTPKGRWSRTQPCLFFEPCTGPVLGKVRTNVVRAPDGAHLCPVPKPASVGPLPCPTYSSGALRYGLTMLGPALAAVGR